MPVDRAVSILARFNAAQHALVSQFRGLTPGSGEHQPGEREWSAAQIVCHVAMANEWAAGVLMGVTPLAEPAPAGFTERFGPIDVPRQKTFPLPPPAVIGCDTALERLRASGARMARAIATLTPERGSGLCVTLPFGTISLFELADLTAAHVARHAGQVERALTTQ
jgi:DinB superfamily